jgi:hypothetical protein
MLSAQVKQRLGRGRIQRPVGAFIATTLIV